MELTAKEKKYIMSKLPNVWAVKDSSEKSLLSSIYRKLNEAKDLNIGNTSKEEGKMADFEIDPTNPVQQAIGILILGILAGFFMESWWRWVVWGLGGAIWAYINFFKQTKEGAIKG